MRQAKSVEWLQDLQRKPRVEEFHPIAIRFLFALRLIALHRRAKRDPVPELSARLGDFSVAIHAIELVETLAVVWPEAIQVSRTCCQCLTPDEATLATAIQAACSRDRTAFSHQFEGLIRTRRIDALWEQSIALVAAEYSAA